MPNRAFLVLAAILSLSPAHAQTSNPGDAACWLQHAFRGQLASYQDLVMSRGMPRPFDVQLARASTAEFPPRTGLLLYDYTADWSSAANYRDGDMAYHRGVVYLRIPRASAASPPGPTQPSATQNQSAPLPPDQDRAHWTAQTQCASSSPAAASPLRVWLLSSNGIQAYSALPFTPVLLEEALARLRQSLRLRLTTEQKDTARGFVEEGDNAQPASFEDALAQLGSLLVPADFWPSLSSLDQLVLVPRLGIGEVPFSLLRAPGGSRLADTTSVWIARSVLDLDSNDPQADSFQIASAEFPQTKTTFSFDHALVVGNPAFANSAGLALPQLPGAEKEARAVSSIMHVDPLLGAAATVSAVQLRAPSADVLYFATHGAAMPDNPLSGFLALAGAPDTSGRWTARDIQSLNLSKTDLAVLSACQTGLGGVHAAGIIGVGRAFALAGVRWVVMSLWNVDDAATASLMQEFVHQLASCNVLSDCLPAVALRKAMLVQQRANPDPRTWGAFVVFGLPNGARQKAAAK